MKSFASILHFICLLAAQVVSTPIDDPPREEWALIERVWPYDEWDIGPAADPNVKFSIKIHLRNDVKSEQLRQRVVEIATPSHPRYGMHLKRDELRYMMKPNATVTGILNNWLINGGVRVEDIKWRDDWIDVTLQIGTASRLLKTKFHVFKHKYSENKIIRTTEYWAPTRVAWYLDIVVPIAMFNRPTAQSRRVPSPYLQNSPRHVEPGHPCLKENSPDCLRELYGLENLAVRAGSGNKIAVSGYLEQYAQYADLYMFIGEFCPQAESANFSVTLVNGGKNLQGPMQTHNSLEANLDIQYVVALTLNMDVEYISVGGRGPLRPDLDQPDYNHTQNEPYMEQLGYLLNLPDDQLPSVLTTSYGEAEQSVPKSYARAVCDEFAKLTARGVSIIFASGDTGAGSSCLSNDGLNRTVFNPVFPATCPFVTSVGSTYSRSPELPAGFSSGGFSNYFKRPDWQDEVVSKYLKNLGTMWEGYYNPLGRGFPDIAAQGVQYPIYDKGHLMWAAGTRFVNIFTPSPTHQHRCMRIEFLT